MSVIIIQPLALIFLRLKHAVSIKLKEPAFGAGGLIIEAGGFCSFWRQQIRGLIRTGNAEHIFKIIKS